MLRSPIFFKNIHLKSTHPTHKTEEKQGNLIKTPHLASKKKYLNNTDEIKTSHPNYSAQNFFSDLKKSQETFKLKKLCDSSASVINENNKKNMKSKFNEFKELNKETCSLLKDISKNAHSNQLKKNVNLLLRKFSYEKNKSANKENLKRESASSRKISFQQSLNAPEKSDFYKEKSNVFISKLKNSFKDKLNSERKLNFLSLKDSSSLINSVGKRNEKHKKYKNLSCSQLPLDLIISMQIKKRKEKNEEQEMNLLEKEIDDLIAAHQKPILNEKTIENLEKMFEKIAAKSDKLSPIILKIKNFTENILDTIFEKYISQQTELQKMKSELDELNTQNLSKKKLSKNKAKENREDGEDREEPPHIYITKNQSFFSKQNEEKMRYDFFKNQEADISSNFFVNN